MKKMRLEVISYLPDNPRTNISLLFVHGGYEGAWCFEEYFLPFFKEHQFKSYALSFRGHGKSEGREKINEFTLADYLEDVKTVVKQIGGKFVLVGHSLGGGVVQTFAEKYPEYVAGIVLMSALPPYGMKPNVLMKMATKNSFGDAIHLKSLHKGKIDGDDEKFPYRCFFSDELDMELKKKFAKLIQEESYKAGMQMLSKVVKDTKTMPVPVKVLGAEFDWFFPEDIVGETAKLYGTEAVIIPNSGHCAMLDCNWKIAANEIKEFVKGLISKEELHGE